MSTQYQMHTDKKRVMVYHSLWEGVTFIRQYIRKDGKKVTRTIFFPPKPGKFDRIREFVGGPIQIKLGGANELLGYRRKKDLQKPFVEGNPPLATLEEVLGR